MEDKAVKMYGRRAHEKSCCAWCHPWGAREKGQIKGDEERQWRKEAFEEETAQLGEEPHGPTELYEMHHQFEGERCVFCGVNMYDAYLYGPSSCDHDPVEWRSEQTKDE